MNILISRLQNIGDMLVFIPALRLLRKAFPEARITLLCKHPGGVEIVRNCPYYDDMIVVRNRSLKEKFRLIKEFRKRKLDYFIISPQDYGRVPWALMGGAKKIVAYKSVEMCGREKKEKLPFLINIVPEFRQEKTETENCINLVKACIEDAGKTLPKKIDMCLEYSWIQQKSRQNAEKLLASNSLQPGKFFALAPFSAKCQAKNWDVQKWQEVIAWLHQKYNLKIVLLGGKPEGLMAEDLISDANSDYVYDFCGKSSLDESLAVLTQARGFAGLDSGPAFLATAAAIPAVVLYSIADVRRWTPPQTKAERINIYHKQECAPCRYKVCPNGSLCMKAISVEEVKEAIEHCLAARNERSIDV
ncbi:glycosyltransferase family 9 protein [Lentisphaerota bacterium ZTH]|nr:glycosyltransferase family 9 protein [Lentisphaerota bacterium]WET06317.1 glycosyltransferase family 9 protein [Lentisphaerota bacterium ZTH]